MPMGFCENLDKAEQRKKIDAILLEHETGEANESQKGESLTETLDEIKKFLSSEFVRKFIAEDIDLNEEERKHLADKLGILQEKAEIEFAGDCSLAKCRYNNFQHIVKNFFTPMLCRADKYERLIKKGKDILGTDFYINYKKAAPFFGNTLPYFDYYVIDLAENDSVFDMEMRKKNGYLEKYEVCRYKDFARDKKYSIGNSDDYLRLFYLFRKLETRGISKEEYEKLRLEMEDPRFRLLGEPKPKIFNFDELEENFIYDKSGENILGVIERR